MTRLLQTARSEEGSLRDNVPQAGVWGKAPHRPPIAKRSRKKQSGSEARPDGRITAQPVLSGAPIPSFPKQTGMMPDASPTKCCKSQCFAPEADALRKDLHNKPACCRRHPLQSAVNPEALRRDLHNKRAVCPTLNTSGNHTNQCEPDAPLHVSRSTQRGLPESSPLLVLLLSSPGAASVIRPHANRLQYAVTNQPLNELFRDPVLHGPVLSARSGGTSGGSVC